MNNDAYPSVRPGDTPLRLDPGEILLRVVFPEQIADPELLARYRRQLAPEELAQEARFRFVHDRHRYLLTRALVRLTLSRVHPLDPRHWCFATNAYGRPHLVRTPEDMPKLSFNVSHTRRAIVLALSAEGELGVDIESLDDRRPAPLEIARHHFSPPEAAGLHSTPPADQPGRFLAYWTLKESYIKARGMGLSIPLDKFGFTIDASRHLDFWTDATLDDRPQRWRFWQLLVAGSHVIAVCAACAPGLGQRLTTLACIPGVTEQPLATELLRQSS